jgi:hypothetical protein
MTRPIRLEHMQCCVDWWGGAQRTGRVETEVAWKVSADEVKARGYNLDFKNPHTIAEDHGDPEELLISLNQAEAKATALRDQLKAILQEALLRGTVEADIQTDPAANARATFERLKPLESFATVDSDDHVRALRDKSRILKSGDGA